MSDCISNLKEAIEPGQNLYSTLKERARLIPEYTHLGPADLCYFVKEYKGGIFAGTTYSGFFHYVNGVDCSSSASIAVYINSLIKLQEKDGWMKKQKFKVVKWIFWIYDPISKADVRVEVSIPGGTNVYSISPDNTKSPITGIQWNFVYVSSILRSFNPVYWEFLRIIPELSNKEDFKDFLLVASSLHKQNISFSIFNSHKNFGISSYLLSEIVVYMRKQRRMNEIVDFIGQFTEENPELVWLVWDALFDIGETKEAIMLLARNLKIYPMLAPLLLKQAEAFLKYEYYEYGLKIAKIWVNLIPESFEAWLLLAKTYFHMRMFKESLIILDIAPYFDDPVVDQKYPDSSKLARTNPKKQDSALFHSEIMINPSNPDFKQIQKEEEEERFFLTLEETKETLDKLVESNSKTWSEWENKSYELLVQLEKELSWGNLLEVKNEVFLNESEQGFSIDNPFLTAHFTKAQQTTDSDISKKKTNFDDSSKFNLRSRKLREEQEEVKENKTVNQGPTPAQDLSSRKKKQTYLEEATVEDKQVTFVSLHSDKEIDGIYQNRSKLQRKRIMNKIDGLFMRLYRDLNLLIDWETEEQQKIKTKNPNLFNYNGIIWVHRGILAERLQRTKLAEKAYRSAIEIGFSSFAWYRLLKIYSSTLNPKAWLVCIAEVLDQAERDGIHHFPKLPDWIGQTLYELISVNGLHKMVQLIKEMEIDDCKPLIEGLRSAQFWGINGVGQ